MISLDRLFDALPQPKRQEFLDRARITVRTPSTPDGRGCGLIDVPTRLYTDRCCGVAVSIL
jgi:hypothetical protein